MWVVGLKWCDDGKGIDLFLFVERQQWGGVGFVKEERCDQLFKDCNTIILNCLRHPVSGCSNIQWTNEASIHRVE